MSSTKFDTNTQNDDVGILLTKVRELVFAGGSDFTLPETATYLKASSAGKIVWYFSETDETSVLTLEAGEFIMTPFDKILDSATIDSVLQTTTANVFYWGVTSGTVGGEIAKRLK